MSAERENLPEWAAKEVLKRYAKQAASKGQFPSERVMANELQISLPTLREGLLRLQTDGCIIRWHGKGTFLAPQNSPLKPVGILVEFDLTIRSSSTHYLPLALQIQRKLKAAGRQSEIYFGHRQAEDCTEGCLCEEFVDAVRARHFSVVAVVAGLRSEDWLAPLREQGVPVVGCNSLFDTCISVDRNYWMDRAVKTLRDDGRRQIAFIGWAGSRPLNPGIQPAHEVFAGCLERHGLMVYPDLIRNDLPPSIDGAGWEELREIWMRPASERPDGMVVSDDILLRGCFEAIEESRIEMPGSLHIVALVSDYFRDFSLKKVSRFEISTEETAGEYVQAILHPGTPVTSILPEFFPAPTFTASANHNQPQSRIMHLNP